MEPMTLGSPTGSPAAGPNPYLPSFLMGGESNVSSTPRSNTLSPTKGRNVSFATSPGVSQSPPEFNRAALVQKTLFGYQQGSPAHNFSGTNTGQNINTSVTGPPTQGLFDSLRAEMYQVQTPTRTLQQNQYMPMGTPTFNQSVNDSFLTQTSINASRITSPVQNYNPSDFRNNQISCPMPKYTDFWITVFGFPESATTLILAHFSQCGTVLDKVFPSQNGNWVHLKFSSRLECDKALNYNEKILGNNIMIGVTHCKDTNLVEKENRSHNYQTAIVRPLTNVAYKTAQSDAAVITSPNIPQRSSGIVNKAMDLLFGW